MLPSLTSVESREWPQALCSELLAGKLPSEKSVRAAVRHMGFCALPSGLAGRFPQESQFVEEIEHAFAKIVYEDLEGAKQRKSKRVRAEGSLRTRQILGLDAWRSLVGAEGDRTVVLVVDTEEHQIRELVEDWPFVLVCDMKGGDFAVVEMPAGVAVAAKTAWSAAKLRAGFGETAEEFGVFDQPEESRSKKRARREAPDMLVRWLGERKRRDDFKGAIVNGKFDNQRATLCQLLTGTKPLHFSCSALGSCAGRFVDGSARVVYIHEGSLCNSRGCWDSAVDVAKLPPFKREMDGKELSTTLVMGIPTDRTWHVLDTVHHILCIFSSACSSREWDRTLQIPRDPTVQNLRKVAAAVAEAAAQSQAILKGRKDFSTMERDRIKVYASVRRITVASAITLSKRFPTVGDIAAHMAEHGRAGTLAEIASLTSQGVALKKASANSVLTTFFGEEEPTPK